MLPDLGTRPSSTSGAAAEERQEVVSKGTIDDIDAAITGGKISVSGHPIYRKKCRNIGLKTKS